MTNKAIPENGQSSTRVDSADAHASTERGDAGEPEVATSPGQQVSKPARRPNLDRLLSELRAQALRYVCATEIVAPSEAQRAEGTAIIEILQPGAGLRSGTVEAVA